jgi:hypothetical protein
MPIAEKANSWGPDELGETDFRAAGRKGKGDNKKLLSGIMVHLFLDISSKIFLK